MPNGESKNWHRFIMTVESFYSLYGFWPESIYLPASFIEELQRKLASEDYELLTAKIQLIADAQKHFVAEDAAGNSFDYSKDGASHRSQPPKATDWLGIGMPHYYD